MSSSASKSNSLYVDAEQRSGASSSSQPNTSNAMDMNTIKLTADTLKRNPKFEFSRTDLLKLLAYFEGELQAKEVVLAVYKSERVKYLVNQSLQASSSTGNALNPIATPAGLAAGITAMKQLTLNDPHAALYRDKLATSGNLVSLQSSVAAVQSERERRYLNEEQLIALENIIVQQRSTQTRMVNVLKDAEDKQQRMMQELDEERKKHELDTAQGDNITYGLEVERTRLRQELEAETQAKVQLKRECEKSQEALTAEKHRMKQIVLLLLADRKKIINKYREERKRSEDLAQILSEEKQRVDTIAEGLEEESKKSLRMEAELEKQLQLFEEERKLLLANLEGAEKRAHDKDFELQQLRAENESLKQLTRTNSSSHSINAPQIPVKPNLQRGIATIGSSSSLSQDDSTSAINSNAATSSGLMQGNTLITKLIQPSAVVASQPVAGPTTGIARSVVAPGGPNVKQQLESTTNATSASFHSNNVAPNNAAAAIATKVQPRKLSNTTVPSMGMSAAVATAITTAPPNKLAQPLIANAAFNTSLGGVSKKPPPVPPNKPQLPAKRGNTIATTISALAAQTAGGNSINKDAEIGINIDN